VVISCSTYDKVLHTEGKKKGEKRFSDMPEVDGEAEDMI